MWETLIAAVAGVLGALGSTWLANQRARADNEAQLRHLAYADERTVVRDVYAAANKAVRSLNSWMHLHIAHASGEVDAGQLDAGRQAVLASYGSFVDAYAEAAVVLSPGALLAAQELQDELLRGKVVLRTQGVEAYQRHEQARLGPREQRLREALRAMLRPHDEPGAAISRLE